ncbi:MAG TPA: phosphopantetheine-binding protein [Opitutaceae bacterium]|jgi:acyl carrier protein|nr:phosphopantetheine-binding protein [Opitutaceae bacterium]
MTNDESKKVVLDIIADIAPDEDLSNVKADVRLRDQLQLDSMDFLDIVMELRKRHGIEVPEADYQQLASLDSSAAYLVPKFNALAAKS